MRQFERKQRTASKVNLVISGVFHTVLIGAIFYFAAREGLLGKKLKSLTVVAVPKEKKIEPPKPKEEKVEPPKDKPKVDIPQPKAEVTAAPPPPADTGPAAAPAAAIASGFDFSDGAHQVATMDANGVYKAQVESLLRRHWNRPDDMQDDAFVAQVELSIDPAGQVTGSRWVSGSGNSQWDQTVKQAVSETKAIGHAPPKGFPATFLVRFDVESVRTENVMQLGSL